MNSPTKDRVLSGLAKGGYCATNQEIKFWAIENNEAEIIQELMIQYCIFAEIECETPKALNDRVALINPQGYEFCKSIVSQHYESVFESIQQQSLEVVKQVLRNHEQNPLKVPSTHPIALQVEQEYHELKQYMHNREEKINERHSALERKEQAIKRLYHEQTALIAASTPAPTARTPLKIDHRKSEAVQLKKPQKLYRERRGHLELQSEKEKKIKKAALDRAQQIQVEREALYAQWENQEAERKSACFGFLCSSEPEPFYKVKTQYGHTWYVLNEHSPATPPSISKSISLKISLGLCMMSLKTGLRPAAYPRPR